MDFNENSNSSIRCNVSECRYHTNDNSCSLERIDVVSNRAVSDTSSCAYTDCGSFESK